LHFHRIDPCFTARRGESVSAGIFRFMFLTILTALCFAASPPAHSQQAAAGPEAEVPAPTKTVDEATTPVDFMSAGGTEAPLETFAPFSAGEEPKPAKQPVERELIFEGLVSYGNYKIFASGYDEKLFTGGVEYDRHSWGRFLGGDMDYVAEFLPFILLDKPLHTSIFGNPAPRGEKNIREYVPGIGISPIGFRLQWFSKKKIKPYIEAKGGILAFTKKVPSSEATYESLSLQSGMGVQVKMSERWGLRLGLFGDFHFSDAFIVPVNPGLDVMNANLGISYHLGHRANQ
jgi:hypothetical protein